MSTPIPAHVPADRVVDFNIFFPQGVEQDYFKAWQVLQGPGKPGVVWTTANGGHWIATGGEVVRELWGDSERLSSEVLAVTPGLGEVMKLIPLQLDAPEHGKYRNAVVRGFAFKHIVAMEPKVIEISNELIDAIIARGECEFVGEVAEVMPINIFLMLIDVPVSDRPRLKKLGQQLTRPDGSMTVVQLRDAADEYLRPYVEKRMAEPGEDMFSRILAVPIDGKPWTVDAARRMCRNLLFGGLDTVAAMLGLVIQHLARHPQDQQQLREQPDLIPAAVDELMRRYPTVSVSRNLVVDVVVDGVTLKAGDVIYLPSVLHNLDPKSFDAPEQVRFDRDLSPLKHTTMGVGAHRCVGAGLARMEIIAFLREWLRRMPTFSVDASRAVTMKGGNVGALLTLPLKWEAGGTSR